MHIGLVVEGGGGYIQKFTSTVLVPPQLYISSMYPTAHTRTKYSLPPSPKYSYLTLTLMRALNDQTSPFNGKLLPPTPHPHTSHAQL